MYRIRTAAALAATAAIAVPAAAQAHVTVQPKTAPAGGFARMDIRVPNERDDAATTKVVLQMPDGFESASYEPVAGWSVRVEKGKLAQPIETDEGQVTEGVKQITWTADGKADAIPPGAFRDFGLSVKVPGEDGDTLTFKALQTYDSGEVVRWIGAEESDNPAPTVAVAAPAGEGGGDHAASTGATSAAPAAPAQASDSGGSDTLAVVALIAGVLGLAVGGAAFIASRRATAPGSPASSSA